MQIKLPLQKKSLEIPKQNSAKNINIININPKRHFSINPINSQFENVKAKIFSNCNFKEDNKAKIKSESNISPLPNIRTPLNHKTEILARKDVSIIRPNGQVLKIHSFFKGINEFFF